MIFICRSPCSRLNSRGQADDGRRPITNRPYRPASGKCSRLSLRGLLQQSPSPRLAARPRQQQFFLGVFPLEQSAMKQLV